MENSRFNGDRAVHPYESFFKKNGEARYTTQKTDSYSLFLLTYQAATGKKYFGAKTKILEILPEHRELHYKRANEELSTAPRRGR